MVNIIEDGYIIDNTRDDGIKESSKEFIADFKKKFV